MMTEARVAMVTGAGSGIGRAVASAFIRAGYRVILAGRRADALLQTIRLADGGQGNALHRVTDVCDRQSVAELFSACQARFGRLDVLFNNAGIANVPAPLEDLDFDAWENVLNTNVTGTFLCLQHAFRLMKSQVPRGGRIINNGSIAAVSPRPGSIAYAASKHAVTGLTKTAILEGRKYDIACSQIDIGNAHAGIASDFGEGVAQADGSLKGEPFMDIENVASAVLYMASLPLEANVQSLTLLATKMPFVGRG